MARVSVGLVGLIMTTARLASGADALPFEIQNGRGPAGLVFSVPATGAASWSRTVQLVLAADVAQPQTTNKLVITGFVETEAGDSAMLTVSSLPALDLAVGASLPVAFGATLKTAGTYKGELVLVQGSRVRVTPLQITVTAKPSPGALPLAAHGGTAVLVEGSDPATLPLRLRNTGSQPITIGPIAATVSRVDKPDSPSYQLAIPGIGIDPMTKTVAPDDVGVFDIVLHGLDNAGVYSVETLVQKQPADGSYQSFTLKMTVYRRDSVCLAILFIAIGAALAWFIRWFVSDGNARLSARRSLALLTEQIRSFRNATRSEELAGAARALLLDVDDRQRDLRWGGKLAEVQPLIDRAQTRFALLQDVAQACVELERIDVANQATARKLLDQALSLVRSDPESADTLARSRQAVRDLALRAAWRDLVTTRLKNLEEEVAAQNRSGSPSLRDALRPIETAIAEIKGKLARDELADIDKALDGSRDALLEATIAELARRADASKVPLGVAPDVWQNVCAELVAAVDAARQPGAFARRLGALQEGQRVFFRTVAKGLASEATAKADAGDSRANRFRTLAADLLAAVARDPLEAAPIYTEALREVSAPDPKGVSRRSVSTQAAPPTAPATGWLPLLVSSVASALGASEKVQDAAHLRAQIRSYGWLVNLGVFLIAVGTGVKALYLDNMSWGGHGAWLLAFLWGAGVQVTGDAFIGLVGIRAKLGGSATT